MIVIVPVAGVIWPGNHSIADESEWHVMFLYENGQGGAAAEFSNGHLTGREAQWVEKGRKQAEMFIDKDGTRHSPNWFPNGKIKSRGRLKSSTVNDGKWSSWDESGILCREVVYDNGEPCGKLREWDEKSNPTTKKIIDNHRLKGLLLLLGNWRSTSNQVIFDEEWQQIDSYILEGHASMKNPKTNEIFFSETLCIQTIGNHIVYIASVNNNLPILFTLTHYELKEEKYTWIFENNEHDFPQRIIYSLDGQNRLNAIVEGSQKNKKVKEEFHLIRVK